MPTTRAMSGSSTPARIIAPKPRAIEQKPERDRDHNRDQDHDQAVDREYEAKAANGPDQSGRSRNRNRIAGKRHQARVGDHERDAERHQHLRQRIAGEAPQQQPLDQAAECRNQERADDCGQPEIELVPDDQARPDVGAQHEQGAVRQIRNAHQPEDQGEAGREQEQQAAQRDAVDGQHQREIHSGSRPGFYCLSSPYRNEPLRGASRLWPESPDAAEFILGPRVARTRGPHAVRGIRRLCTPPATRQLLSGG